MKNFKVLLLILLMAYSHHSVADGSSGDEAGFQNFFANMRQCLFSDRVEECLPARLDEIIAKPAEGYRKEQFVSFVANDSEFRKRVSSCFVVSAKIIMDFGKTKLFRSDKYACEVKKIDGSWKLTAFYNFFSNE